MKYEVKGNIPTHIKTLKDVTVQGNTIFFGSSWTKDAAESVVTHATQSAISKESHTIKKKAISENDKAKITEMVGGDVLANIDKLGVYEFIASTDEVDSDGDKFEKTLLEQWSVQYADGVPFVFRHDYDYGIGSTFKADVLWNNEKNRWELIVGVYVLPSAKLETDTAKNLIDGGVYKKCSVRVRTGMPNYIPTEQSPTGQSMWIYGSAPEAKALELSLVPWGANQSAARIKSENFKTIENMDLKVKLKHLGDVETQITADLVSQMSADLHEFRQKAANERKAKEDLYVNNSLTLNPQANKSHLEILAKGLSESDLSKEIDEINAKLADFKAKQLNPQPNAEGKSKKENLLTTIADYIKS